MAKEFAAAFYNSSAWRKCRKAYISTRESIDGGMCEYCKEEPGYIVDHIEELTPWNISDPSIALNFDNFQYLCLACHNAKTFSKDMRYILTANGEVVALPPFKKEGMRAKNTGAPTSKGYADCARGGCSTLDKRN